MVATHNLPLTQHKEAEFRRLRRMTLRISSKVSNKRALMSPPSRSEAPQVLTQELREIAASSPPFDRDLAASIGKCIRIRRNFCGLSKQQLGVRLGIDSNEVEAYEQGEKRMSCGLLLETAKQLKAAPRFFFQ
jgi:ribosome-binding protein aMBF1 (putative translation factor)